jgi:hypothetical protein
MAHAGDLVLQHKMRLERTSIHVRLWLTDPYVHEMINCRLLRKGEIMKTEFLNIFHIRE